MSNPETRERLRALREAKQKKEEALAAKREENEVALLELEERLEKEHGARGVGFEIVDATSVGEGLIAVKLGEAVLHTRFINSKMLDADVHDYVLPCVVHPAKEDYSAIVHRRPGLALECAGALARLFGVKLKDHAGKA